MMPKTARNMACCASASAKEKLVLDFGDNYLFDYFIRNEGLDCVIDAVGYPNIDTMYAMTLYYILCSLANRHALTWQEGNYARLLYPNANLVSQRISEFLSVIGQEDCYRGFFEAYIPYIYEYAIKGDNILIDSTGLPNSIHFPLTTVSIHNGKISNEVRLIYVTQQETGYPLYTRYSSDNVIDVSTLIRTIAELKEVGLHTKFAVLDSGYYDKKTRCCMRKKVSFLCRLK